MVKVILQVYPVIPAAGEASARPCDRWDATSSDTSRPCREQSNS